MGNRAFLHIASDTDTDAPALATFYSHHGGQPHHMLRKLALWRSTNPGARITDFVRWALDPANETNLELTAVLPGDTGWGDREHDYRLHPQGLGQIRVDVQTRVRDGADESESITGDLELYAAAASALTRVAAYMEHYGKQQGWTEASYDKLPDGYDPRPVRAEADRFAALADKARKTHSEPALFDLV